MEVGSDSSIGFHTDSFNIDIGYASLGRVYLQLTTPYKDTYTFTKFSINTSEIAATVGAVIVVKYACYKLSEAVAVVAFALA